MKRRKKSELWLHYRPFSVPVYTDTRYKRKPLKRCLWSTYALRPWYHDKIILLSLRSSQCASAPLDLRQIFIRTISNWIQVLHHSPDVPLVGIEHRPCHFGRTYLSDFLRRLMGHDLLQILVFKIVTEHPITSLDQRGNGSHGEQALRGGKYCAF